MSNGAIVLPYRRVAIKEGKVGDQWVISLYMAEMSGEIIDEIDWPDDWPQDITDDFLREQGYEVM